MEILPVDLTPKLWKALSSLGSNKTKQSKGHLQACLDHCRFKQVLVWDQEKAIHFSPSLILVCSFPLCPGAVNYVLKEHSKDTSLSCNCFCKAISSVSEIPGHCLLIANRLKRALQTLNDNNPGKPKNKADRAKGKRQKCCSFPCRGTAKEKVVKKLQMQPSNTACRGAGECSESA